MKPLIVGQSPARSGDGRPFTGASGMRLCRLLGIEEDYRALTALVDLTNIFGDIPAKRPGIKGDVFDSDAARFIARNMLTTELNRGREHFVLCGKKVATAFGVGSMDTLTSGVYVRPKSLGTHHLVSLHILPHPSGINLFWNDRDNISKASAFLKGIVSSAR